MNKTWRCSECGHFAAPNWCKVKEIKVDCNFDGPCDHANPTADKIRQMGDEGLAEEADEADEKQGDGR